MDVATPRRVSVFGSTGSIGRNTIELLEARGDEFQVEALTAHSNIELLCEQAVRLRAKTAVIGDDALFSELKERLRDTGIVCAAGASGLLEAAAHPVDWTMVAIVGMDCLRPALEIVAQGGCVAMANKECLAAAGKLFVEAAQCSRAQLLPVDSEHNAIFQLFDPERAEWIEHITLTASGGPFRNRTLDELENVTPAQALQHPTWSMGAKISIDSATLMNKGLELIEAHWLFPVGHEKFRIVLHPQSVVHAMVTYVDGSVMAHMSAPDMRIPIAHALAYPKRMRTDTASSDLTKIGTLDFEPACEKRFPALRLARTALERNDGSATVLNAANEVAVAAFLELRLRFTDILPVVEGVLEDMAAMPDGLRAPRSFDDVFTLDRHARRKALESVNRRTRSRQNLPHTPSTGAPNPHARKREKIA